MTFTPTATAPLQGRTQEIAQIIRIRTSPILVLQNFKNPNFAGTINGEVFDAPFDDFDFFPIRKRVHQRNSGRLSFKVRNNSYSNYSLKSPSYLFNSVEYRNSKIEVYSLDVSASAPIQIHTGTWTIRHLVLSNNYLHFLLD
jgi:hypothetical protein